MKDFHPRRRSWLTKLWVLMILVFVSGKGSKLWAASDFATTTYNKVIHKPSITEPYFVVRVLFYDAKDKDSFFTHYKADGTNNGPAVYVDGNYICSPDWELAWPDGNGDDGGSGSDGHVKDQCKGNDGWWGSKYEATIDGVKYTIKFYNPVCDSDDKRYVYMYIFINRFLVAQDHTVTIKGRWRTNGSKPVAVNTEYTWTFDAFSMGTGGATTQMTGIGTMKASGNLNSSAYGAFTIGTAKNYKVTDMVDKLDSKKDFNKGDRSFSDIPLNCYNRTNYYTTYSNNHIEYILSGDITVNEYTTNVKMYQWYRYDAPGYARPKNVKVDITDMWKKEVRVTWDYECYSDKSNTSAKWNVYRYPSNNSSERECVASNISFNERKADLTVPDWDVKYTYEVVMIPSDNACRSELTASISGQNVPRNWGFFDVMAAVDDKDDSKIKLTWGHNPIDDASGSNNYTLTIQRSSDYNAKKPDDATWDDLTTQPISSKQTTSGSYSDGSGLLAKKSYYYRLKINVMEKDVYSDVASGSLGGSYVTAFKASRGTYTNAVKLQWEVKQVGDDQTNFSLQRRPLGCSDDTPWTEIYTTSGTAQSYSYDDVTAQPGSYNQYKIVTWYKKDDGNIDYGTGIVNDGFCLSSGIVSGNVTYGTGTAVPGVKVMLKRQNTDGDALSGMHSLLLRGDNQGLVYSTDKDEIKRLFSKDFTIQMWIYPEKSKMNVSGTYYHLFNIWGFFSLRLLSNGSDNYSLVINTASKEQRSGYSVPADQWSHLTIVYDRALKQARVYNIKGETVATRNYGSLDADLSKANTFLGIMRDGSNDNSTSGKSFQGYLDEFRIFTRALTREEIELNYNHPLAGNESGLAIYYPLDEGLSSQTMAYDFSKTDGTPNGRHADAKKPASGSTNLPSESQLSLMAYTDSLGYYEIRGVPFGGEGTSYSVIPTMGIHEFSPARLSRFVSQASLVHNSVDFEDVSSFPVSGKIMYSGTTYPVEGVNLYVDGALCTKNGDMITTNENGEFTISVPIGKHYIQVKKSGHIFANDGRYPADPLNTGNEYFVFDRKIEGLEFRDTTLVNFSGRVVGGDIENDNAVGFALSHNNIGITRFALTPVNTNPYINALKVKVSETSFQYQPNPNKVEVPSASNKIQSKSWRGATINECKTIYIETDSLTGEFSALVPPLEYALGTMTVKKTGTVVGGNVTVDLTNPLHEETDTLHFDDGTYELYTYNNKLTQVYHSEPKFTVIQDKHEDGSFGIDKYEFSDGPVKDIIDDIYTVNGSKVQYNYGVAGHEAPLFIQDNTYTFLLEGYEPYANYDADSLHPVEFKVPLKDVVVTIENALSSDQSVWLVSGTVTANGVTSQAQAGQVADLKSNQLQLNEEGKATYKWTAGLPNVASPYTRTISMSYDINGRTIAWDGSGMEGIILGDLPSGNNFVTSGPDKLLMILRDPPGTGSSAEWSEGYTYGTSTVNNDVWSDNASVGFTWKMGVHTEFLTGVVAGVPGAQNVTAQTMRLESKDDLTTTAVTENEGENGETIETSTATTKSVATSGESDFVGADADVFIGQATNLIFGNARRIGFERTDNGFSLGSRNVISTGMEFKTTFNYTQSYIENTLIPNYEMMRESVLRYASPAEIDQYHPEKGVGMHDDGAKAGNYYYTSLTPDDEHYGEEGTYTVIIPRPTKIVPDTVNTRIELFRWCIQQGYAKSDTIAWINNQIENWINYLKLNEEEKVKAFEKRKDKYSTNYSFDGGTSVGYTIEEDSTHTSSWEWVVKAGAVIGNHTGFDFNGWGLDFDVEVGAMGGRHESTDDYESFNTTFSYTLADEGIDAISVDVYRYGAFGPIFRTRGGQTSNPYEGKVVTKYYKPGTTIMEATMQIEVPQISVTRNEMVDIPSGSAANYTIQLSNASEIGEDVTYTLFVLDETNPDGAQISIDGKVLTEGRLIKVPGSQTITKSLQLRQTNTGILDYYGNHEIGHELNGKGIGIVFASESQPEDIADTIFIKARFVPSSSPVSLALSNSVMNSQTGSNLIMSFKDFDRYYDNQKAFRLQFKKPGSTDWTQLKEYVLDDKDVTNNNEKLPGGAVIDFAKSMSSFSDGNYLFRVVSVATYGNDEIYRYSDEMPLVKDMMIPRPLGTPEPSDGVYDIGDDLSLTFNEKIVSGGLTMDNNFTITGVLNGARISHETALSLKGSGNIAATDANIMLAGKDFSFDMWLNLGGDGTILSHGNGTNKFSIGTDADGKLIVNIGKKAYRSDDIVPKNEWIFLSLNYKTAKNGGLLSAKYADDRTSVALFTDTLVASYNGNGALTVGSVNNSAIHELLLWDEAHSIETALLNRSFTKSPSTRHLIGYWKMDEGEGTSIRDYSRNRHMTMADETWYINNENKAVNLDGESYLSINASQWPVYPEDDYAVEFWMRGGVQAGDAQLVQMGEVSLWLNTKGELQLTGKGAYSDSTTVVTLETSAIGLNDNAWHHIALNVLRQGSTGVYVDGKRCLMTNSSNLGSIVTNSMIVGARRITEAADAAIYSYDRPFKGQIDEIRVWNATMNADLLTKNRKVRFDGSELGLIAYYSFEKKTLDDYNQVVTLGNPADLTGSGLNAELLATADGKTLALSYVDDAPALRAKLTETNVGFKYTASDDKIVIEITEDPATIEGCTLNFAVRDVSDMNGNYMKVAKWSAFVNRKELVWDDDELMLEQQVKDEKSITAKIVNKGGQQQTWSLTGIPSWLNVSADYGVTNPRNESTVTFTVKPSTPIGKYEETIYLTGNDGIDVPLTLNVKVTGNQPDWTVNAKEFENSMNVIGTLDILGVMSDDEDDIIAAFIGEQCRGIAHPVYKERYDGYYVTMDIYGAPDDSLPLTFRAYDASTGALYPEVVADPATSYEQLTLKGTYANPVQFTALNKIEQQTELKEGWNWLSLYVNTGDMKVASVFEKIADDVIMVKSQTGSLTYEQGSWGGDLTDDLSNGQMYAVKMKADRTLRIVGERVEPGTNPITVYNGWNWIGYYGRQVSDVTDAMADLDPEDGNIIKAQRGVAYYDTYEWAGSLAMMEPGVGYKLHMTMAATASKSFRYPSSVVNLAPMRRAAKKAPAHVGVFQPVDFRMYSGNATMAVQVYKDGIILPNAEVGVFADGECRAAAFTGADGKAYLTIPGDESVTLTFKVADGAEIMVVSDKVNFEADGIYGTPKKPVIFLLGNTPTRVADVESDAENGQAYDLQGRKVNDGSVKGIRIIDGKKRLDK